MAYLEVHQSLRDHRKVLALATEATELDIPEPHAVGHILSLWLWALDNSRDGSLACSGRIVERMAAWIGEPGQFARAMVKVGLLDEGPNGSLWIHDWMEYAGRLIERREQDKQRKRLARGGDALRAAVLERDGLLCGICGATVDADDVHIDHIMPVVRGGLTVLENLRVTHSTCNLAKGSRLPDEEAVE